MFGGDWLPAGTTWTLQRSGSPGGPFEVVHSGLPGDTRTTRDDDVPLGQGDTREFYYRLKWDAPDGTSGLAGYTPEWHRDSDDDFVFGQSWGPEGKPPHLAPAVVRTIRGRIKMLLKHRNAELVYVYREKWDAPADTNKMHQATGAMRPTFARDMQGTRVGGWYSPMQTLVTEGVSAQSQNPQIILGEMIHWPPPKQRDILRTLDGRVYEVGSVRPNKMHGFPTSYTVQLTQMDDMHAVLDLPLPDEWRELSAFPRRQFSRSMSRETLAESRDDGVASSVSHRPPSSFEDDR